MPNLVRSFKNLPPLLQLFCAGSIALTAIGLIARFICAHFLNLVDYPYGYYVTRADALDLMCFYVRFQHVHSLDFFSLEWGPMFSYPAAVAPLYWLLTRVRYAQIPFVLFGAGGAAVLAWFFSHALERAGLSRSTARSFVLISALFSYPFYLEFARGNMEIFMWMATALGIYCILRDRPWLGATLLGFAIAMKGYPFIFLALLFSRRKYAPIALSIAVAAAYSVFSLWFVCPNLAIAQHSINEGLANIQNIYIVPYSPVRAGVDHSLYGLIKRILPILSWAQYARILSIYTWTAALTGLIVYFTRIRTMPMINQVLCLTIAAILLPPMSFDYTLIHLYTPFVMLALYLVDRYRTGQPNPPGMQAVILCLIVLLSQVGEVILHGERLGGQIKAVTLIALFILTLRYRFTSRFDGTLSVQNLVGPSLSDLAHKGAARS